MQDITVSFTDAQWARIVAASPYFKHADDPGDVDVAFFVDKWSKQMQAWVKEHEKQTASVVEWE